MRQLKFERGGQVESVQEAVAAICRGKWLFHHHKPLHFMWLKNWSLAQIENACIHRSLFYAVRRNQPC